MTIAEALRIATRKLIDAGSESAALDAAVLLRHLLGWSRTDLLVRRDEPLSAEQQRCFDALIARRADREPVAYIVGTREFLGLDFAVGPGALVPRPETEQLVEWAATWLAGKDAAVAVDIGTGSGAIAIGLIHFAPPGALGKVIAIDPSEEALAWAQVNAMALAPEAPLELVLGSLLDPVQVPVDLVLANLPYLTPEQTDSNPDLACEPRSALVSGTDGLDLIRALLIDLPRVVKHRFAAILELDPSQASTVAHLSADQFPDARVSILNDLSGRARFVTIERGESG
jgi:release factor glutamine methyltransferase